MRKWSDITSDPRWNEADPGKRDRVRTRYFDKEVAPRLYRKYGNFDKIDELRNQFMAETLQDIGPLDIQPTRVPYPEGYQEPPPESGAGKFFSEYSKGVERFGRIEAPKMLGGTLEAAAVRSAGDTRRPTSCKLMYGYEPEKPSPEEVAQTLSQDPLYKAGRSLITGAEERRKRHPELEPLQPEIPESLVGRDLGAGYGLPDSHAYPRKPFELKDLLDPAFAGRLLGETLPTGLTAAGAAVGVTAATKSPFAGVAAAGAMMYGLEGGGAYNEARELNIPKEQAAEIANAVGIINAAVEQLSVGPLFRALGLNKAASKPVKDAIKKRVMKELAKKASWKQLPKTFAEQGAIEGLEEIVQESNQIIQTNRYLPESERIKGDEMKERLIQAGYGGMLGGITLGGMAAPVGVARARQQMQELPDGLKPVRKPTAPKPTPATTTENRPTKMQSSTITGLFNKLEIPEEYAAEVVQEVAGKLPNELDRSDASKVITRLRGMLREQVQEAEGVKIEPAKAEAKVIETAEAKEPVEVRPPAEPTAVAKREVGKEAIDARAISRDQAVGKAAEPELQRRAGEEPRGKDIQLAEEGERKAVSVAPEVRGKEQVHEVAKEPWEMTREEFVKERPEVEGYLYHGSPVGDIKNVDPYLHTKTWQEGIGFYTTTSRKKAGGYAKGEKGKVNYVIPPKNAKILDMEKPIDKELWDNIGAEIYGNTWNKGDINEFIDEWGVKTNSDAYKALIEMYNADYGTGEGSYAVEESIGNRFDATKHIEGKKSRELHDVFIWKSEEKLPTIVPAEEVYRGLKKQQPKPDFKPAKGEVEAEGLDIRNLPEHAQRAIMEDSMMRRTNEGGSIDSPDPYKGVKWKRQTVEIESLKDNNKELWGNKFTHRKSVTKGDIVINDRGEVIDGNNRLYEAIQRGDRTISAIAPDLKPAAGKLAGEEGWLDVSMLDEPAEKLEEGARDISDVMKNILWTVEGRLKKGGKSANKLAKMFTNIDEDAARYYGEAIVKLKKSMSRLSKKELRLMTAVIDKKFITDANRKIIEELKQNPDAQAFAEAWKKVTDGIFFRAKALGVKVTMPDGSVHPIDKHYVTNYIRHELTTKARKELGVDSQMRADAIQHLIDTDQAKNEEDAIGLINEWLKKDPLEVHYGSLEKPRLADLPVEAYESDFTKLLPIVLKRSAYFLAAFKQFGFKDKKLNPVLGGVLHEDGKELWNYARKAVMHYVHGEPKTPGTRLTGRLVGLTANAGLSFPISGIKNLLLGDVKDLQHYGIRRFFTGYWDLFFNKDIYETVIAVGAIEAGTHDIEISKIVKWNPGLMHPMEKANRIKSVARAVAYANDALAILKGNSVPTWESRVHLDFRPKVHARHVLEKVFRLENVNEIVKRGRLTKAELKRVAYQGQARAQGVTTTSQMPLWLSNRYARYASLFYRMAYRASSDVWHHAVKPAARGNLGPLIMFLAGSTLAGEALYALALLAFRREHPEKDRGFWRRILKDLIHGEGAALFSNYMEGYGTFWQTYYPAVARNANTVVKNIAWAVTGKKFAGDALKDTLQRTVSFYNGVLKIIRSRSEDYKDYDFAKQKVRKWLDITYGKKAYQEYEPSERTPYYRGIRESMLGVDKEDIKIAFKAAFAYLVEKEGLTIKEAFSRCKSSVSMTNPVKLNDARKNKFNKWLPEEDRKRVTQAVSQWNKKRSKAMLILNEVANWYNRTRFGKK